MIHLPWWGWLGLGLIVVFFLGRWAMSLAFRALIRRELTDFVHEVNPDITVSWSRGAMQLTLGADTASFELDPFYDIGVEVESAAARAGRYWQRFDQLAASTTQPWPPISREKHGPNIIPHLRPRATLPKTISLPHRMLDETGLVVAYLLLLPRCLVTVTACRMTQLGLDVAALDELATQNVLSSVPADALATVFEKQEIAVIQTADGFSASRLLAVPRLLTDQQELVALVVESSTLLLAPIPENGDWSKLHEACRIPVGDGEPILDVPLVVTKHGMRVQAV